MLTGLTDHWVQTVKFWPAATGGNAIVSKSPWLCSAMGCGEVELRVIPSVHPELRTSFGWLIRVRALISKRPSKMRPPRRCSGASTVRDADGEAAKLAVERWPKRLRSAAATKSRRSEGKARRIHT